ncbi:MAG: FtsB family cell division protein [Patescibacteria group bacterium]
MKKNFRSLWSSSRLIYALGIILIIAFSVAGSKEYIKKHQLDKEIAELESEVASLQVEQEEFLQLLENYNSENFIEQEARVNFNYKRKGEQVVIIRSDENKVYLNSNNVSGQENTSALADDVEKSSNPKLWWDYFFGEKIM